MILELINEKKRMSIKFADKKAYESITNKNPNHYSYYSTSEKNNLLWLRSTPNLFDSQYEVENNMKQGLDEDGSTYYQNQWTGIRFSIVFEPAFNKTFNLLRSLTRYKGEPLKIKITSGDNTYQGYFTIGDISLESGTISFEAAQSGSDGFWYCGDATYKHYLSSGRPAKVQDTPNKFLGKYKLNNQFEFITDIDSPIIMRIRHVLNIIDRVEDINAKYISTCKITHDNTGVEYYMEFKNEDDTHLYDSNTFTHTYNGAISDQPLKYMTLTGGNEQFTVEVHSYKEVNGKREELPLNIDVRSFIEIIYEDRRSGLSV